MRGAEKKKDIFTVDSNFSHLKVKDLLEAREMYHIHFMHKKNVVATAIGRYRIRKTDHWPDKHGVIPKRRSRVPKEPKTFQNSEVRYYSWPCLLVFVEKWIKEDQFGWRRKVDPEVIVPSVVYMPDGRRVPVCVVQIDLVPSEPAPPGNFVFPRNVIGGGFPVIADVQEQEKIASIGCLVTDGHLSYAVTNRHVCGEPGEIVSSVFGGNKVPIGLSSKKQISRKRFSEVYPQWPPQDVYLNLDVGLIEIDDVNNWTPEVYGIGRFKKMEDLSGENISLKLIGAPVRAYGCASRAMRGEIAGLFYRYKSSGGFEYVSDFLVGPRNDGKDPLQTHHGDSGTIWFLDLPKDPRDLTPLAIQWGGQVFAGSGRRGRMPHALCTCLSTACNLLDVDIVAEWATELPPYWGAVGHYSIATLACEAIGDAKLRKLMTANLDRVSFPIAEISKKKVERLSTKDFVPLADVPDLVWKMGPYKRPDAYEKPNHFADMDKPHPATGKTLLEICKDRSRITPRDWKEYYAAVKDEGCGILPFRIWQIYRKMVDYASNGRREEFVCAAGVLSHYVGDACQPLHISFRYDGDTEGEKELRLEYDRKERKKVEKLVPVSKGVHGDFDKVMVEYHTDPIKKKLPRMIRTKASGARQEITGGRAAAEAAVELMRRTFASVDPKDVCQAYVQYIHLKPKERSEKLWKRFGSRMMNIMADGAITLASLWESAWTEGKGGTKIRDLGAVDESDLAEIYVRKDFLRSCNIDTIQGELD